MRTQKRSTRFASPTRMAVAVAAASALLLAGCSPANESDSDQAPTASDNTPATAYSQESEASTSGLTFSQAYVTAKPTDKAMTGVFGALKNITDQDINLKSAESSVAGDVEFHIVEDGVMKEVEDGFTIKAGETMVLQPGHEHIMIMGNNDELAAGDAVTFTLKDAAGKEYELKDVPVRVQQSTHEHYGDAEGSMGDSEMNMEGHNHEGHDHEGHTPEGHDH